MINILKNIFIYIKFKIFYFLENISFQFPLDSEKKVLNFINIAKKYSMSGSRRMYFLSQCIEYVHKKSLPGDFVECGVWKGGNIILLKNLMTNYKIKKKQIYAYDTFEGMTKPTAIDKDIRFKKEKASDLMKKNLKDYNTHNIHSYYPVDKVRENIFNNCKDIKNIKLIKGDVLKTLLVNDNIPNKISILRLDTDWYKSTKIELEILFPKLVKNGVLIIDDYGDYLGCKKAVDEYFKNKKFNIFKIDSGARMLIKSE